MMNGNNAGMIRFVTFGKSEPSRLKIDIGELLPLNTLNTNEFVVFATVLLINPPAYCVVYLKSNGNAISVDVVDSDKYNVVTPPGIDTVISGISISI
jgi:aromatic ring-opening dioxygenase LigB subunit